MIESLSPRVLREDLSDEETSAVPEDAGLVYGTLSNCSSLSTRVVLRDGVGDILW